MRARDYDYAPLTRGTLRGRVRAAGADNRMVIAGTVGVLMTLVPVVVLIGLVATGNATDIGALVLLVMLLLGGIYVLFDILHQSGGADAAEAFARANDLTLLRASTAPHYAGSLFADQSHAVHLSVRTRDEAFVEVGERFPLTALRSSHEERLPELFLRARLAGRATRDPYDGELVTPGLHTALHGFAGTYAIEVTDDELTVFGSRGLDPSREGRVQEAFALTDELVARANATLVRSPRSEVSTAAVEPTPSGIPIPTLARPQAPRGRTRGPLTVIGWTLALLIVGPLLFAIVMSNLDDHLRGDESGARIVVSLVVLVALAGVGRLVRAALTPRREPER